jgi:putative ABC transport system permease protein
VVTLKRTYLTTLAREIKQSFGRFAAVFGIFALGVGFLAGLLATAPDMHKSLDKYFDEAGMADVFIKGTMGLTADDVEAVAALESVDKVMPAYVTDVLMDMDDEVLVTRVYGLPLDRLKAGDDRLVNRLDLLSGRMPESPNECLVERGGASRPELALGARLTVSQDNEDYEDIGDIFKVTEYTVVGIAANPFHFSHDREPSTVGIGRLGAIIYVDESCYALDVYTDIFLTAAGSSEWITLTDEYESGIDAVVRQIEALADVRSEIRYADVIRDAREELDDAKREYAEAKLEAETELADAWQEILDGRAELADAWQKIQDGKAELADAKATLARETADAVREIEKGRKELQDALLELEKGEREFLDGQKELEDGEREYQKGRAEYLSGKRELTEAQNAFDRSEQEYLAGVAQIEAAERDIARQEAELEAGRPYMDPADYDAAVALLQQAKAAIESQKAALAAVGAQIEAGRKTLQQAWAKLSKGKAELDDARAKLDEGRAELDDARKELDDGWAEYYDGLQELADAEATLEEEITEAKEEILKAEADLAEAEAEYEDGLRELREGEEEYFEAKADAEKQLADAWAEITDAEEEIATLEMPEWYVFDLNSNVSYASFSENVAKIDAIAKAFPAFFFLVAALVALTTMTRMVDEQRTEIGTLKALGYSPGVIVSKYILYCALAGVFGCAAGLLLGFRFLPEIIYNIFDSMYYLPDLITEFRWDLALIESGLAFLCTLGTTVSVCRESLKEKPAALMRPRAPKAGKRVFLEHIPLIWSRLKFSYKATVRNLARYKKHFFMTVFGVAGCTALVLTGFGLRDSIRDLAITQFEELTRYDLYIRLDKAGEIDADLERFLHDSERISGFVRTFAEAGYVLHNGERISTTVYVPDEAPKLEEAVNLRDRVTGAKVTFGDTSVVLTEKMASTLDIRIGDTFILENADGKTGEFVLSGITENYAGGFAYINRVDYEKAFRKEPVFNVLMVNTMIDDPSDQDLALSEILSSESALTAEFTSQIRATFDDLLSSIDFLVGVIIVAAGALAVIVLYNLININIEERRKELATLKVLGFHNEEVAGYIFREVSILAVIGTGVGLVLGVLLHSFVIVSAESPDFMFGRGVSLLSLVLSALVTLVFSGLVQLVMARKLKGIKMVDSMKVID